MRYSYEAELRYSEEEHAWYAEFPGFDGSAYADGDTVEEAVRNAAGVLELTICDYLDGGRALPAPSFHEPPLTVISVEVDDGAIAASRCMSVLDAAELLGVTPGRVSQLLGKGQLEAYEYRGTRLVTIASVNARRTSAPRTGRPRKAVAVG